MATAKYGEGEKVKGFNGMTGTITKAVARGASWLYVLTRDPDKRQITFTEDQLVGKVEVKRED